MSQLVTAADVRAVIGGLWRQQVMDLVRGATFIGTLLLAWISLHPFADLSQLEAGDVGTGNEALTYVIFAGLAVLTFALALNDNLRGLATLLDAGVYAVWRLGAGDGCIVARSEHIDQTSGPDDLCYRGGRDADVVAEDPERADALV